MSNPYAIDAKTLDSMAVILVCHQFKAGVRASGAVMCAHDAMDRIAEAFEISAETVQEARRLFARRIGC